MKLTKENDCNWQANLKGEPAARTLDKEKPTGRKRLVEMVMERSF